MPSPNPSPPNPQPPGPDAGWFSRQSRRMQATLLALLMFTVSAALLLLGFHERHAGERLTSMAGRSDWADTLLWSAATFALGVAPSAAALGWKPEDSRNPPQK